MMIPDAMQRLILDVQLLRDGGHPRIADDLERAIHAWRLDRASVVGPPKVIRQSAGAPLPGPFPISSTASDNRQGSGSWLGGILMAILGFCFGVLLMGMLYMPIIRTVCP